MLKGDNETLKERVAELERLMKELTTAVRHWVLRADAVVAKVGCQQAALSLSFIHTKESPMRSNGAVVAAIAISVIGAVALEAQSPQPSQSVPRLINLAGVFIPADGRPAAHVEVVTLAIYADQSDGPPLWQETQSVNVDASGRYTLLLGATETDGVPLDVFASGDARWLGIVWARPGEVEGPRVRLTSVPYALRASDADTLGGKPPSAYVLAPTPSRETAATTPTAAPAGVIAPTVVNPGTMNSLAKYVNGTDLGNSAVSENGGFVGVGTLTPFDTMHVRFTNTNGAFTGYAVQNLGNTSSSFSGMLFYDQAGALAQFQGYNNFTHEYRINNIALNGSINFMTGGTSRFFVENGGDVGIGTATPRGPLEVARGDSSEPLHNRLPQLRDRGRRELRWGQGQRHSRSTQCRPEWRQHH